MSKLVISSAPHIKTADTTQRLMLNVIIALLPCAIAGVFFFGWGAALVLAVAVVSAVLAELVWQKLAHQKVRIADCSAALTGLLLGLCISPVTPWWVVMIGSFFAIIVVKQLFGGIGDNFLNPALTARAVLLASWPAYLTTHIAANGFADAITSATPLASSFSQIDLLLGTVPGAIGETSKIAILIGFAYLLFTKTIRWEIPVFVVLSTMATSWILGGDPIMSILTGGVLFGAVFMATDYVTSPMNRWAQIVYAIGIGVIIVVIRNFGDYPEGVTYAILLMNIAAPLLDRVMPEGKVYGHSKKKEAKA